jgi:hypothetical protein
MGKNLSDEIDQIVDLYGDHIRISACPCIGEACISAANPENSHTGFDDRLDGHFERKIARVSTATVALAK